MAELTITIPDTALPRIQAAFAGQVDGDGNPITIDAVWMEEWLKERIKDVVRDHEATEELRAKSAAVAQEVW